MAAPNLDIYSRVFGDGDATKPTGIDSPSFLNDSPEAEERASRVMRDVEGSEGSYHAWEGPAREEDRFYHGWQWDDVDRMRMEQLKRPAITFNEIKPTVNGVSGLERLNRVDVRFQTRALDSPLELDLAGDLATESVAAADDLCNATEEDSDLAKNASITGMGWGEVKTDYDHDINGRVVFGKLNSFEMRWDPNCRMPNLEDSEWRAHKREMSRKNFEKLYGKDKLEKIDMSVPEMPYGQTQKYELVTPYYSIANEKANPQVGGNTNLKKTVTVIKYQWIDRQPIYRFEDADSGEITTIDEDKWKRLKDRMEMLGGSPPPAVRQLKPVYRQTVVSRGIELEEPVDLPGGFSLICMTGEWDDEKKRYVGIVRDMIDPQKTKNKAISSALGFHITNAKGGVIFKTRMFSDPIQAKDQWSRADAWIEANDEANLKEDFWQREPAQMPSELPMFYTEATKEMSRVSGINEELVGLAAGQTPSQTAGRRVQAGLVVLGWFFDNLNRHRRERARVMLDFIREFWTQGQLIQVGGDQTSQAIPLLKDSLPVDYTMVLDDSIRHNPNLKAQIWSELMESGVLQALMKFGLGQIILKLLKYSPFPAQLVNDIQREAAQNPPQPPQKGGRGKQEAPELVQGKVGLMDAQRQKALAQARMIDQTSGIKVAELALEGMQGAHKARHDDAALAQKGAITARQALQKGMAARGGF